MQHKLKTASAAILQELKLRHGKMVFQQIFFAAQRHVNKVAKVFE